MQLEEYTIIFQAKEEIYDEITERYLLNYAKFDMNKLRQINGNTKDKIHNALFYILHHFINGVEIESINEKINYREVILLLTSTGYSEDKVDYIVSQTGKDITLFLTDLVEDGKKKNEIRHDFLTENIVESLFIMYMGIQELWLLFICDDIDSIFEKNFNMT